MKDFGMAALGLAVLIIIPLLFVVAAVWWLEDRFGSISAVATVGGIVGVVVFAAGAVLAMKIQRHTLATGADFVDAINSTQQAQVAVWREYARGEREATSARARMDVIDMQQTRRLADQQAKALIDVERQRWEQQHNVQRDATQPAPLWSASVDGDGDTYRRYE